MRGDAARYIPRPVLSLCILTLTRLCQSTAVSFWMHCSRSGCHCDTCLFTWTKQSTKDEDSTIRSSALSNLASVCELLGYSLQSHVGEVSNCVASLLLDKEPEVRRGCVNLITQVLRGLGAKAPEVLGSELKQFYRLVRRVEDTDADDVTRFDTGQHWPSKMGQVSRSCRACGNRRIDAGFSISWSYSSKDWDSARVNT